MIRQAVILAAGKGTRIRSGDDDAPKPLHMLAGLTLIKRTVLTLQRAGVERVYVVVGFMADRLRAALLDDPDYERAGVAIEIIDNRDYELGNGVSLLKAKGHVSGPFLLSMCDHIYDATLPKLAAASDMQAADLWLCVDRGVDDVYDIDDATKVRTSDDRIVDIGKALTDYDAIDCGVFAVSQPFLDCLEEELADRGDCSLSDGVRRLAAKQRARVIDIGSAFWQDVDTPEARAHGERALFRALR